MGRSRNYGQKCTKRKPPMGSSQILRTVSPSEVQDTPLNPETQKPQEPDAWEPPRIYLLTFDKSAPWRKSGAEVSRSVECGGLRVCPPGMSKSVRLFLGDPPKWPPNSVCAVPGRELLLGVYDQHLYGPWSSVSVRAMWRIGQALKQMKNQRNKIARWAQLIRQALPLCQMGHGRGFLEHVQRN